MAFHRCALSLVKVISMGLRSGLVGRQEEEPRAAFLEDRCGFLSPVAGEIVEDDHVAGFERRGEWVST